MCQHNKRKPGSLCPSFSVVQTKLRLFKHAYHKGLDGNLVLELRYCNCNYTISIVQICKDYDYTLKHRRRISGLICCVVTRRGNKI
ncbi:unnamed protein product [Clavelina lepadiformis]|uniref:Uncharacterized protein n=1 Tax=Clavelina lepadiformis TaxID=159417 RepID=A0ABP0F2K5_CLALP